MNSEHLKELLGRFQTVQPAQIDAIEAFERQSGILLPHDYCEFLRFSNGGEGFIGQNSYAMLWKVDDLIRFNREYEVDEYAPGLLLFGSSGGGEAFAFDIRPEGKHRVVSVPFVGMGLGEILPLSGSFCEFLEHLSRE